MRGTTIKTRVVIAASVLVATVLACIAAVVFLNSQSGPFTVAEVTRKLSDNQDSMPIYVPKPGSAYAALVPRIYYYGGGSDGPLVETYLLDPRMPAETSRVVRFFTSLRPPALDFIMNESKRVPVGWANNAEASTCAVRPFSWQPDEFKGKSYETCLTWWSREDKFWLYSSLPLEDTLILVNSLENVR